MVLTKKILHIGVIKMTEKPEWAECTKEEDYHRYMSDWKDVVVRTLIDDYGDFDFRYYLFMVNHAGWCPVCRNVTECMRENYAMGRTWGKDIDGNYECSRCNEREANEND